MALQKFALCDAPSSATMRSLSFSRKVQEKTEPVDAIQNNAPEADLEVDLREVYFLIMHFLSDGPCHRTYGQFWNELLEHQLLPRRYHAWYSRSGAPSEDENDDGSSFPLSYNNLVERYPHIEKDHLVKLLKRLLQTSSGPSKSRTGSQVSNAADVPTVLGTGSFSLLDFDKIKGIEEVGCPPIYMRWPHMHADQVRGLNFRELGGGFSRHHRAPSIRAACYTIAKPSMMVQKMQNIKKLRGHRNAVYCAIFDSLGRYVVTGSDDRLVKIWSMETAYCLASCRGHEGDITDLAVSSNNGLVASASNDCNIRVWRLPDGLPISALRGHTGAVTAIAFSPRPTTAYQLLSSSDDGTCRIWDSRYSHISQRIYVPKPPDPNSGKGNVPLMNTVPQIHQIFCCAFNASGTVFVTGSSDTLARVWSACKPMNEDSDQPNHEMDVLAGHENDVNYVQFSGCAVPSRVSTSDVSKDDNIPKFKNSWFTHDYIVTCSRDGSAIIWIPKSRRSHSKVGKWTRAYHLKVPPPPMPPQPPRAGPRQRILPTPRGVNMIVWSLDNRFVLAAIMDCRICVWNAVDGSLLHSLTGHTESTYVLDVHPFNPRIAMSAGYDGKTIVWDIWEGTPVRIYDIGRFKLVDGKFSPDGTSIILSDDVGQLYILSTGQGEAQKDAVYDQFFLGDYRPLVHDTNGNALDQETQLAPYRRNMQDFLCDSGMIPYPEPYQSAFQKRRLGALGLEWRPPPIGYAVGVDISRDQGYQMLPPLADLDLLFDPMPQFLDAVDWEPEVEIPSDDTDSEYNVTEDSNGRDQGSLSVNSSCEQECSMEYSDVDGGIGDMVRRSRRKKLKFDIEVASSSGRRIKKHTLDEYGENSHRNRRSKHRKLKRKRSKKKYFLSKEMRPQRAAARNALSLFSKMGGASSDGEDEYIDSEEDSFESGSSSTLGEDDEFYNEFQEEELDNTKGKTTFICEPEVRIKSNKPEDTQVRKSLVFKLAIRDPNRQTHVVVKSNDQPMAQPLVPTIFSDNLTSHGEEVPPLLPIDTGLTMFDGCKDGDIKWGGAKARTSKRLKFTGMYNHIEAEGNTETSHKSEEVECYADELLTTLETSRHSGTGNTCENGPPVVEIRDENLSSTPKDDLHHESAEKPVFVPTKFRFKSSKIVLDMADSSKPKSSTSIECYGTTKVENCIESHEPMADNSVNVSDPIGGSVLLNPMETEPNYDKKCLAVYTRSKTCKPISNMEEDTLFAEVGPSMRSSGPDVGRDLFGATVAGARRARSGLHRSGRDVSGVSCSELRLANGHGYITDSVAAENTSLNRTNQNDCENWGSGVGTSNSVRVTRGRRGGYHTRDISPPVRNTHRSGKKMAWLTLSVPEGCRYIPQLGDEVAYMREGHQNYLELSRLSEDGPWSSIRGNIRAVEFCKVEDLEYSVLPGSGDSCCKLKLRFVDSTSSVFEEFFRLTLPELNSFPDFLVERTWYDAAINRNWSFRDRCKVWWQNAEGGTGDWWEGRVVSVKDISPEFPENPWERYCIRYKSGPGEQHCHSAWELYDLDTQWEPPHLDEACRDKLLSYIAKLEKSSQNGRDRYGVRKLKQTVQQSMFLNRFPAPLSLEVVESRLENNYYRSVVAVEHDIKVMLENLENYGNKNGFDDSNIALLSSFFTKAFSTLL